MADNPGYFKSEDSRRGKKPKGTQHHRTKFLDGLKAASTNEEQFISKILALAQEGNTTCLNICATRLWKEPRATLPSFELPQAPSKQENATNIISAMVTGDISPDMAVAALTALRGAAELTEMAEILERLKELEGK